MIEATSNEPSQDYQAHYQRSLDILNGRTSKRVQIGPESFTIELNPRLIREQLGIRGEFVYLVHTLEENVGAYDTEMSVAVALLPNGEMICESASKSEFLPHYPGESHRFRIGFQESDSDTEKLKELYLRRALTAIDILASGKPTPS